MTRLFKNRNLATIAGLLLSFAVPVLAQAPESATQKVTRRLEELLQPGSKASAVPGSQAIAWPGAKAVEKPQLPPNGFTGLPPQPPVPPAKPRAPGALPEGPPLVAQGPMPKRGLPTKPLIQLPAVDVEVPLPLPILAHPKSDRASLDDATLETSQAAALERVRPRRSGPVPFVPVNLPDPFENIRAGGLRNPPAESDQPPPLPIRTPAR